jgi:hypothetical protein
MVQSIPHAYTWHVDDTFQRADVDVEVLGDSLAPENNLMRFTTVVQGSVEGEIFRSGFETSD